MAEAVQSFELIKALQTLVVERLAADTQLSGPPHINVIAEDLGDIDLEIQKRVGAIGSGGGVVVVTLPTPTAQDARLPDLLSVEFEVNCIEAAVVNRSAAGNKVQGNRIGEIVLSKLNQWQSDTGGWTAIQRTSWSQGLNEAGHLLTTATFTASTFVAWEDVPEE